MSRFDLYRAAALEEKMSSGRQFWIGTSWKMNGSADRAAEFAQTLTNFDWAPLAKIAPFVLPPFPYVERLAADLRRTPVRVGVQNIAWKEDGPFTGEISPLMAVELGAALAEIGHSERRALFGETDETVRDKVAAAVTSGLMPIICIGESHLENSAGAAAETIIRQAKIALSGVAKRLDRCIIAYEPIWSIGEGGRPAEPEAVSTVLGKLREALIGTFGAAGAAIPFLYGGSVSVKNAAPFSISPHIDGLFIGRAAWTANGFIDVITRVMAARSNIEAGRDA